MPPISDNNPYPPEGSGDILRVYKCDVCKVPMEPTTEKVAEVSVISVEGAEAPPAFDSLKYLGLCTKCYEDNFAIALDRPGGRAEVELASGPVIVFKVHAGYNLYNVDNFKRNI